MTESTLPRYYRDANGFCYAATVQLQAQGLRPWDGSVDARGYAVEAETLADSPVAKSSRKRKADTYAATDSHDFDLGSAE